MKITVYMLTGYHWDIPGTIARPFVTIEEANKGAASLVNLMRVDCQDDDEDAEVIEEATPENWTDVLSQVRDIRSDCNAVIEPVEMEVPVTWIYADKLLDALIENNTAWSGEEDSVKEEHKELIKANEKLALEIAHALVKGQV